MADVDPPLVPPAFHELTAAVHDRGGRLFLVGGGVRDHLMGNAVKDWDLEVFGLDADALQAILARRGGVNTVGRSFGVLKWRPFGGADTEIDVSIPRRDSKVGPGHRGIAVEGDPSMSTREASRRRDLTINAMMWDLHANRLEDPWNGLGDLRAGLLRAVDESTFLEDPLRALRVIQFAARLGFRADGTLVELCQRARLDELPAERILGEWEKLLLKGRDLTSAMQLARDTNVLQRVFPVTAPLETDETLQRAVAVRNTLEPEGRRWVLMLAAWLWPVPPPSLDGVLDRLGLHTVRGYPVRDRLYATLKHYRDDIGSDAGLRHLSVRAELALALRVRAVITTEDVTSALARAAELQIETHPPPPLLLGRHLKGLVPPGPHMGELLGRVYQAQLDGAVSTFEEAKALLQSWIA